MIGRGANGPGLAVAATLAGAIAALLTAMGLAALARPADRAARTAALEAQLDRMERLQRPGRRRGFIRRARCAGGGAARGAALVEAKLRAGLGQAKLSRISFAPTPTVATAA